jgi:competence protein ComEC
MLISTNCYKLVTVHPNLNSIPLLRLLLPFIAGVVWAVYKQPKFEFVFFSFGVLIVIYFILLLIKQLNANYQFRWIYGVCIATTFFFGAASLTSYHFKDSVLIAKMLTDKRIQLTIGEIVAPTQLKPKSIKAILKIKHLKKRGQWIRGKGKVMVYFQKEAFSKQLEVGDVIAFKAQLKKVSPPKNPNEFDFKKYLSYHFIEHQVFLRAKNWKRLNPSPSFSWLHFATNCRNRLIKILQQKGLQGEELAVASALILGNKEDIGTPLKNAYASAGAMHVLAVSGLHVGVLFLIFSKLFSFLERIKYGGIFKGIVLLLILWSYALLTGLSPSVMRAATMFSFIVVAKMMNRNSNLFNTLAASAFCLLIYNPLLLIEVGFQLSYCAVLGIVIIQPWITNWFHFKAKIPRLIWEITAVSIAAQIATFPLGLLYFHQFPNYFMLSNLIVIPLAVVILYLGLSTLSFYFVPLLSSLLALGLTYSIKTLNYAVQFIEKIPYSLSENIRFGILDSWLIYLFIGSLIALIAFRKFKYLLFGSLCFSLFLMTSLWTKSTQMYQRKLIIYNIPKHTAINLIDGTDQVFIADQNLQKNHNKLKFHIQNNWITHGLEKEEIIELSPHTKSLNSNNQNLYRKNCFFQFYGVRFVLIDSNYQFHQKPIQLQVDYLILTKDNPFSIAELITQFTPQQLILDASHPPYQNDILVKEAHELGINCWSVLNDGAFQTTIN